MPSEDTIKKMKSHILAKSVCKTHMPASRIYKELSNSTKWKQTDQLKNGQKIWTFYQRRYEKMLIIIIL